MHYDRLIRLAALVCRHEHDAEDAVQSALERAWKNRESLRASDRIKPWLDRIVVREAIVIARSRERSLLRLFRREAPEDLDEPPALPGVDRADWADLVVAFARLTADQRAVVALHLYAGYPVADVAAILGVPHETVRSRLRLAREKLRRGAGVRR